LIALRHAIHDLNELHRESLGGHLGDFLDELGQKLGAPLHLKFEVVHFFDTFNDSRNQPESCSFRDVVLFKAVLDDVVSVIALGHTGKLSRLYKFLDYFRFDFGRRFLDTIFNEFGGILVERKFSEVALDLVINF